MSMNRLYDSKYLELASDQKQRDAFIASLDPELIIFTGAVSASEPSTHDSFNSYSVRDAPKHILDILWFQHCGKMAVSNCSKTAGDTEFVWSVAKNRNNHILKIRRMDMLSFSKKEIEEVGLVFFDTEDAAKASTVGLGDGNSFCGYDAPLMPNNS